jgi:hypothetical protein
MKLITRIKRWVRQRTKRHGLLFALTLSIGAALVLTTASVIIYTVGGFSRYDLSRPGYEKERQEVSKITTAKTYDTTSPVDSRTFSGFLSEFDGRVQEIKKDGDFSDASLSDEELLIK